MALRLASRGREAASAAARWRLLRSYTALARAQFREAPAPAAFARMEPLALSSSSAVLTSPARNSLLLDSHATRPRHTPPQPMRSPSGSSDDGFSARSQGSKAATTATYELLLQRLYQVNRFSAVKLGLENMHQLNEAFGDPASRFEIVHVAGTNGKGSVAFKVAKALERSGYKTGLFVSPHVACFRERIQVNGALISETEVCEALSEIFNISAQLRIPATFFEITTMLAFLHFAKQGVDCVVLETGLGGRLDSTNIVTPALSVITSIGMDHTRVLGNTREAIAREKAGIIKPNVPVVVGPNTPIDVMMEFATRNNAPLAQVLPNAEFNDDYNAENTAIAREACVQLNALHALQVGGLGSSTELCVDLSSKRVASALEARPPCRFQVLHVIRPNSTERKVTVVLDVAHNPPAIERLADLLLKRFPDKKLRFVCGFSADKAIDTVLATITAACRQNDPDASDEDIQSRIHLVKANHPRGASLEEINHSLARSSSEAGGQRQFSEIAVIKDGVDAALAASRASPDNEVVVVCGSVFLMAEARQALGLKEPIDSAALNAVAGSHLSTPEMRLAAAAAAAAEEKAETAAAT